tara:strand:+ start:831 stop:1082 length:252 start_codon:yes stop_codon:yes gene_type:complete
MERFYKVAVYVDSLDTNPTITTYSEKWEALDAAHDAIEHMTQWEVDHSPYAISEDERDQIQERNSLLVKIFDGITFSKEERKA